MRRIRTYGLIGIVAIMAVAFTGPSSAMAESTALCEEDVNEAVCPAEKRAHQITLRAGEMEILTSIVNVKCIAFLYGTVESPNDLGEPLEVKGNFEYFNCVAGKTTCTVEEWSAFAPVSILKTAAELGSLTSSAAILVKCGFLIKCMYGHEGLSGHALGGLLALETGNKQLHVTYTEQTLQKSIFGENFCPSVAKLDALFVSTDELFIRK